MGIQSMNSGTTFFPDNVIKRAFFTSLLLAFVLAVFTPLITYAAIPDTLSYKGSLTDSSNNSVSGTHDFTMRIYDASSGGTLLYSENHTGITVTRGSFDVLIGNGTNTGGSVTNIRDLAWDQQYFISLEITSLSTGEMSPRTPINSAAYSFATKGIVAQTSAPSNPKTGALYFNTGDNTTYSYTGSDWIALALASSTMASLNSQTGTSQTFATSSAGTDFDISSAGDTHTFSVPDASDINRGFVNTLAQSFAGLKTFLNDIIISGNATSTNLAISDTASTSALIASNSFTIGNFSGFLKATAGLVSTEFINLESYTTGILGVSNGGTGLSSINENELLIGDADGFFTQVAIDDLGLTTTDVAEGDNLYWTDTRFDDRLSAITSLPNITTLSGLSLPATQLTNFGNPFYQFFSATTTTALTEGVNLYFTDTRVDARINATSSIGTLSSASNLKTVGGLFSGSIVPGFGPILTGNTITGTTLNGTTGLNTGSGAGTQRINSSSNLVNIGTASTTLLSVLNTIYVGSIATTTIVGDNATSTFSGGVNVITTGGLSSAVGITLSGGDLLLSSGKIIQVSTATSPIPSLFATDIAATSLSLTGSLE